MSASPITVSAAATSLDFTDPASSTYSNGANAQVNISGTMALISGDSNNDGEVNAIDNNNGWLPQNGQTYIYLTSTVVFRDDGSNATTQLNAGTLTGIDNPLPVELISFNARPFEEDKPKPSCQGINLPAVWPVYAHT